MKNKFILIASLIFVITTIIISCNKEDETTSEMFKKESFIEQQKILMDDEIVIKLNSLGLQYKSNLDKNKSNELPVLHDEISNLVNQLFEKYGENNIMLFIDNFDSSNHNGTIQKAGCKLKENGTVDYSTCNGFWENFVITIKVAFCPSSAASELYQCAQDAVCKTC